MSKGSWDSCFSPLILKSLLFLPSMYVFVPSESYSCIIQMLNGAVVPTAQRGTQYFSPWVLAADGSQLGPSCSLALCWRQPPCPRFCLFPEGSPHPMPHWCDDVVWSPCLNSGQFWKAIQLWSSRGTDQLRSPLQLCCSLPSPSAWSRLPHFLQVVSESTQISASESERQLKQVL